ncbi:hypothetical protein [Streptomyces sp. NPDC002540]
MNDAIVGLVGALAGSVLTAVGAHAQAQGARAQARAAQDAADAGRAQWARESRDNSWVAFHDISREIEADIFDFTVYMRSVLSESLLSPDVRARKACRRSVREMQRHIQKLKEALEINKLHGHSEVTEAAEGVTRACVSFVNRAEWWVLLRMRQTGSMTPWDDDRHAIKHVRSRFEDAVADVRQARNSLGARP